MTQKEESRKLDYQIAIQTMLKHPLTKVVLFGGAVVGLIFISGLVMKVVSNSVISYKDMKESINK